MTMNKNLLRNIYFDISSQFFLLAFGHFIIIISISLDLRVIRNISGLKYHCVVPFLVGHVYDYVKCKTNIA